MEAAERNRLRTQSQSKASVSEEVTSMEWKDVEMSAQEVDLIYRMHRLVGDRMNETGGGEAVGIGMWPYNSKTDVAICGI
ncbi:hypothetical protein MLD38_033513 [Melastoma candidum]|uniref:Uncharacterized protein n=1 Tax=Melastoma candidum TaxID=119954 RepID=A0ACB9M7L1_9MYRT|nr:hypothetical protein MLD38_033513 [Melastoma candidum]